MFDQVGAGGDLYNYAVYAAVNSSLHVVHHTTGETKDLRTQVPFYDLFDRGLVRGRYGRHTRLDTVYPHLGQLLCNPYLILFGEDDPGLLLAVAQSDIMDPHLFGGLEILYKLIEEIPRANKPVLRFPRLRRV